MSAIMDRNTNYNYTRAVARIDASGRNEQILDHTRGGREVISVVAINFYASLEPKGSGKEPRTIKLSLMINCFPKVVSIISKSNEI